jgi:hypothetical protein
MSESIFKLQPDRTVHLRGFDHLGASAAIHNASPSGFTVSGQFQDSADFAVVVLYDADNFYEHPRLKHLPNFDFDGLTLQFDAAYSGLMPLNCRKYATIDWPYLDVAPPSGPATRIRLADHATVVAGADTPASGEFEIAGSGLNHYDRLTLWYQNLAFDYIVPGKTTAAYPFFAGASGQIHSILVRDRAYTYVEQPGDSSALVAANLIAQLAADPEIRAAAGDDPWVVRLSTKLDTGATVPVNASGYAQEELHHIQTSTVARQLRDQINACDYSAAQTPFALQASVIDARLLIQTVQGGYDANFITLYAVAKNDNLTTSAPEVRLSGGASGATLRVTLDFAALGLTQIRQMWLTLAPRLTFAGDYQPAEWSADFTNWIVSGPETVRRLQVAGPGSVRVSSLDRRCDYSGFWIPEAGFFQDNSARAARMAGSSVTIQYDSPASHEVWIGTSLYGDRGAATVELDGSVVGTLSALLAIEPAASTRRRVAVNVPPGQHTVRLTAVDHQPFYFDYLEAAVPGELPAPLPPQSFETPALDYSTDHTYKLPPARILWMLDQLGCRGRINEYIGVFWWNQRIRIGGVLPEVTLTFQGDFQPGDQAFLDIGGQICGKTVLGTESPATIARHFAHLMNATYVGIWARTDGDTLIVRARSAAEAYRFPVTPSVANVSGSTGAITGGAILDGGSMGIWQVDPTAGQLLNRGARAWHADFFQLAAAGGRPVTTALSMELVNPPDTFPARFPDGAAVLTATGFGGLHSAHCAFRGEVQAFQAAVLKEIAALQSAAGLSPSLQCGEFTWWYFSDYSTANPTGGMGYYDAETATAALASLGRPLHVFTAPNEDPVANAADAVFLRNRLRDHLAGIIAEVRAAHPATEFEVLFPYDVNYPVPAGIHNLGGRLNRFINLPIEWESKVSAGFDRFRIEALDHGAWSRDLDLARSCLRFPLELGWPAGSVRAMIPVFRGGYPWRREVDYAREIGMEGVNLWAFDHVCLYGWPVGDQGVGYAQFQG